jgi:hypothetical protein
MKRTGLLLLLSLLPIACGGAGHPAGPRTGATATVVVPGAGADVPADLQLQPQPQSQPEPAAGAPGDDEVLAGGDGADAEDSTKIVELEAFGPLRFGATEAEIRKVLGAPKERSKPTLEGATGGYYSAWSWAGADADMVADKASGPWRARRIGVSAPSKYATKEGIRIGSTRKEVEAKYKKSKSDSGDPDSLLVGSPYGGLLFMFKDGVVTAMSIGVFGF